MNPTRNRGFVFIEFKSHHEAARAHGKMTRADFRLSGQKVRVDWAEPLNEPGEDVMSQVHPRTARPRDTRPHAAR
jgi:heterogeneous nuclear ribonucleoprotein R